MIFPLKDGFTHWKQISFLTAVCFAFTLTASDLLRLRQTQASVLGLSEPSRLLLPSRHKSGPLLKGLRIDKNDIFSLSFYFDSGEDDSVSIADARRLIDYFLAGLTVPADRIWVNLSPYEENRVLDELLLQTSIGRDLLEQDYVLKQLASSLTHPDTEAGRSYWKAREGNLHESSAFSKVWITPEHARILEDDGLAVIEDAGLSVMTERDYLALKKNEQADGNDQLNSDGAEKAFVGNILPLIKNDVNNGKNFIKLRQIYYSLLLATWFKRACASTLYDYYLGQSKIAGIDDVDPGIKNKIFALYTEAFKKGTYDVLRSRVKAEAGENRASKVRYFSGGFSWMVNDNLIKVDKGAISGSALAGIFKRCFVAAAAFLFIGTSVDRVRGEEQPLYSGAEANIVYTKVTPDESFSDEETSISGQAQDVVFTFYGRHETAGDFKKYFAPKLNRVFRYARRRRVNVAIFAENASDFIVGTGNVAESRLLDDSGKIENGLKGYYAVKESLDLYSWKIVRNMSQGKSPDIFSDFEGLRSLLLRGTEDPILREYFDYYQTEVGMQYLQNLKLNSPRYTGERDDSNFPSFSNEQLRYFQDKIVELDDEVKVSYFLETLSPEKLAYDLTAASDELLKDKIDKKYLAQGYSAYHFFRDLGFTRTVLKYKVLHPDDIVVVIRGAGSRIVKKDKVSNEEVLFPDFHRAAVDSILKSNGLSPAHDVDPSVKKFLKRRGNASYKVRREKGDAPTAAANLKKGGVDFGLLDTDGRIQTIANNKTDLQIKGARVEIDCFSELRLEKMIKM